MKPNWRRFRLWATIFTGVIGLGLIAIAVTAPASVRGEARVLLVFTGIILPLGFFGLLTLTGWQRGAPTGVVVPPLIASMLKWHGAQILPIVFILFLVGVLQHLAGALERGAKQDDSASIAEENYRVINDNCITDAAATVKKDGGDPQAAAMKQRIAKYCNCMATQLPRQFTPAEFARVSTGQAPAEQQQKSERIIAQCQREAS